ncbi:major facilitator superfamily domain-containing protein [Trametes polyzona]|nr:major facilitator superfamily domain-containing protein [Trametes polyzona]
MSVPDVPEQTTAPTAKHDSTGGGVSVTSASGIFAADASNLNAPNAADVLDTLKEARIRHRSELQPQAHAEDIELAPIGLPTGKGDEPAVSTAIHASLAGGDLERGGGSNTSLGQTPSGRTVNRSSSVRTVPEGAETAPENFEAIHRRKSLIHFAALCGSLFVNGWNDGTTGPMLPRIQEKYGVGFAIVSLIFVFGATGFLSGAFINVFLTDRFGFGKVLVLGSLCQIGAYAMLVPAGPFPLMCFAYLVIGFTLAIQAAQATGYVASLKKNSNTKMGYLHGSYGLGALLSPLVATEFSKSPKYWSFHFIISAGLYVANTGVLWHVFRGRRQEEVMDEEGETNADADGVNSNKFRQMIANKDVHFLSFFALIYVGIEVTMGGWSVTYILEKRHGSSNSGYISSGFFGGLMLGRILLLWFNKKVGERRALFLYAALVIGLEVTVWVVSSLIENAVAVAFVGLLLGPMFPILMNHSTTILPRWLLTACAGYIAGAGQAGSAVLPFITGLLASKFGITTLPPFVVSMMSTLLVLWALIPRARYVPT